MAYAQQQLLGDEAHAASLAASVLDGGHEYGAVFTRRWVVELILDLVGYTSERDLATLRAIEPACGSGAFLGPMVERLSRSCRLHGRQISDAVDAIRACDLQPANVRESRVVVEERLDADGWLVDDARAQALLARATHFGSLSRQSEGLAPAADAPGRKPSAGLCMTIFSWATTRSGRRTS